jgi:Protein of unknown function (DUF1091)
VLTQASDRATVRFVVKSIVFDYVNKLYLTNYSVKQYIDPNNRVRIFFLYNMKEKIDGLWVSGEGKAKVQGTNEYVEFFKGAFDYCNMGNNFVGQTMQKIYMPIIERYGNLSLKCPININSYFMDFPLTEIQMPPLVPRVNNSWILKGSLKNKIPGKRFIRVCDLTITGSINIQ